MIRATVVDRVTRSAVATLWRLGGRRAIGAMSGQPSSSAGGLNIYAYVRSRPTNRIDPNGLLAIDGSCSVTDRITIETAERKVKAAARSCIPCHDRENFLEKLDKATVSCAGTCKPSYFQGLQVDAYAEGRTSITLTPCGINPQVGCIEATLVHELTHLIGYGDEKIPREYEKRCFGCAPDRPAYP